MNEHNFIIQTVLELCSIWCRCSYSTYLWIKIQIFDISQMNSEYVIRLSIIILIKLFLSVFAYASKQIVWSLRCYKNMLFLFTVAKNMQWRKSWLTCKLTLSCRVSFYSLMDYVWITLNIRGSSVYCLLQLLVVHFFVWKKKKKFIYLLTLQVLFLLLPILW